VPELVEVEHYRTLAERALGREVASVDSHDAWFLKGGVSASVLSSVVVGHRFIGARRIGKLLLLDIESGPVVGVRFGMTGSLLVDGDDAVGRLLYSSTRHDPAWDRWSVTFTDGGRMVVHDPRRLGGVTLDPDTSHLGPDAAGLGATRLGRALAGSTAPLKARLLDQSRVAGIGNLIADEILWRAGLSPLRLCASLTPTEVRRLHRHLVRTLADLTERGGSHLGDLMDERHPGGLCPKDGCPLERSTVGGRTSWWCPAHQLG
jgi:formamidopyrimidine-DNA glycosylase